MKRLLERERERLPLFATSLLTSHVETSMKMMWEVSELSHLLLLALLTLPAIYLLAPFSPSLAFLSHVLLSLALA